MHLIGTDPLNPEFKYIVRLKAPILLMCVRDMDKDQPLDEFVAKDFSKEIDGHTKVYQICAMPFNDGVSNFNLSTMAELEWILDSAWKWYSELEKV